MKNLKLYIVLAACMCWIGVQAQVTHGTTGSTTVTEGVDFSDGDLFVDSGGTAGNYSSAENGTTTLCPAVAGDPVTLTFNVIDVETRTTSPGCWDFMNISDANGPIVTTGCGEESGDGGVAGTDGTNIAVGSAFTSTGADGCLTVFFDSDGSVTEPGWEAAITVASVAPPLTVPTLGEWGLIVFALLLLNMAILFVVARRRKSKMALS